MSDTLRTILTIKQITRYVKMKLDGDAHLQDVWIRGEISNFVHQSSGHMYFSLKDAESKIKCVMFSSHSQRLSFIPRDGALVVAKGNVTVYEKDGQYQLYVTMMQPDGLGSLHLAFEKLKQKLEQEGLFDARRKKPLPPFPRGIGIITSPTGAAVRDIITTLKRRYPSVYILVHPVLVQGDQAAASIARAIKHMNEQPDLDLLIVGRGGGSLEELWAFNEEIVARSLFASKLPIISAVGHETDFTIADFVADVRAATPTAAAELAVPHQAELQQRLKSATQRIHNVVLQKWKRDRAKVEQLMRSPMLTHPHRWLLLQPIQRLENATEALNRRMAQRLSTASDGWNRMQRKLDAYHPKGQVKAYQNRTETATYLLHAHFTHRLHQKTLTWQSMVRQLDALSPLKVMQRGYSLVYEEHQNQLIRSVAQVQIGDTLQLKLKDGHIKTKVVAKEEDKHE